MGTEQAVRRTRQFELDFDSLAVYPADEAGTQPDGKKPPHPFSGTRHKYTLVPGGGVQYTLDAVYDLPPVEHAVPSQAPPANDARPTIPKAPVQPPGFPPSVQGQLTFDSLADQSSVEPAPGSQKPPHPFSGTGHKYSLISGGIQFTLDAVYTTDQEEPTTEQSAALVEEEPLPEATQQTIKQGGLFDFYEPEPSRSDERGTDAIRADEAENRAEREEAEEHAEKRLAEVRQIPVQTQVHQEQAEGSFAGGLAEVSPETVSGVPTGQHAGTSPGRTQPDVARHDGGLGRGEGDGLHGSLGDGIVHLSSPRRRVRDDGGDDRSGGLVRGGVAQPSQDFRITEAHHIGEGGLTSKLRDNLAAIRTLKQIEAEERGADVDEQIRLARYAGWGALSNVFEGNRNRIKEEWREDAAGLKTLLTDEEYTSARRTTPNAHFTSPIVVSAIWQAVEALGMRGSIRLLEPAMGVGHFFGLMPETFAGSQRIGVELDDITARIAKLLYPDSTIFAQGFETTKFPDGYFDLAVGNVPFGDYGVSDPQMKPFLTKAIHDYFFAKSLDKLRPGGILALITSRYTMDKKDSTIRNHLAQRADLIGAIRLPNTAFKGNAGTEVTTDILFLQKRLHGAPNGEAWKEVSVQAVDGQGYLLNEYYVRHPEMLLGEMTLQGTMYSSNEPTLSGELTLEMLARAIARLPHGIYQPKGYVQVSPVETIATPEELDGVKDGAYAFIKGKLVKRVGMTVEQTNYTQNETFRIRGMMQIRDAVSIVFATQLEDAADEQIVSARTALGKVYDQFVSRFGYLHADENQRLFADDPDAPLLRSLEYWDKDTQTGTKTPVFEQRTLERYVPVESVETASEALAVSLNETGGIHWERMSQLTGMSKGELRAELQGQVFATPEETWQTSDEYLSGNVREKLQNAQAAAALDKRFAENVEALTAVQPEDIKPGDINARLGAGWIPTGDIQAFIVKLLGCSYSEVEVMHAELVAQWSVQLDAVAKRRVSNTTTYGTSRCLASDLIEGALNMRVPTVYDIVEDDKRVVNQAETLAAREAQQKIKDLFSKWLWEDPKRAERLARIYNDRFNTIRLRTYDGSFLTLPGMNRTELRAGDLDPHQKAAVWRVIQNKNVLIGHAVGAGKTNEMTAACMELRRLGLAKKPMIVVPNNIVGQWGEAFLALYPRANIFVAGKEFFEKGKREQAMARIATGTFDAVIISHKTFESLPVSNETFSHFVNREIDSLTQAMYEVREEKGDNRSIVKALERAKLRLEKRLAERTRREKKDKGVTWEQLGIDRIFVDEADLFKNLSYTTKMQRLAGLPNSESNRAMDLYMKSRYVNERGGGVIFATGTPISNSLAEMYTLHRYLAPELLQEAGIEHFDAWAANFGEAVTALEIAPDGSGYRMHTRFAKFVNLPELLSMFRTFADIQTADMLNLSRPAIIGGKPTVIASPATPELKEYVSYLVERAQKIRGGGVDPREDNMLTITNDGRKAALDLRLMVRDAEVGGEAKIHKAARMIHRMWEEGRDGRTTQLVFCDLSTPSSERWNVYHELKSLLLAMGVSEHEIAFIHDAETDQQKQDLYDAVNAGKKRVLFGSTGKMGAGTNVQKRLIALHHLEGPWRPRDIEQREGRILRQGNMHDAVHIFRYVTEGSFDAYIWQTLETKARFINQVMSGRVTVREAEDLEGGTLSYAEIKAIASGNPLVLEKVRIDTEVRRLDILRAAHLNQQYDIAKQVRELPGRIGRIQERIADLTSDLERRTAHDTGEFAITIGEVTYQGKKEREKAKEALIAAIEGVMFEQEVMIVGRYKGFELFVKAGQASKFFLRGTFLYEMHFDPNNMFDNIREMDAQLRDLERVIERAQEDREQMEKNLSDFREQLGKSFEHEEHLRELLKQQQQINEKLDLDKSETQIGDEKGEDEEKLNGTEHLAARRGARKFAHDAESAAM